MDHGRFHERVGSRKKVISLSLFLLLVTVLASPSLGQTRVVSLPSQFDGFMQMEFSNVAGIVMSGQTLSIDFVFEDTAYLESIAPVWAQLLLQTGPHGTNAAGDYPYSQYVVFRNGTSAYLLDENRGRLGTAMTDWNGGLIAAPAPTFAFLSTDHGSAGADMLAYPSYGERVGGIHYDIVLPNTGETIYVGRIGLKLETAYPRRAISTVVVLDPPEIVETVPPAPPPAPPPPPPLLHRQQRIRHRSAWSPIRIRLPSSSPYRISEPSHSTRNVTILSCRPTDEFNRAVVPRVRQVWLSWDTETLACW